MKQIKLDVNSAVLQTVSQQEISLVQVQTHRVDSNCRKNCRRAASLITRKVNHCCIMLQVEQSSRSMKRLIRRSLAHKDLSRAGEIYERQNGTANTVGAVVCVQAEKLLNARFQRGICAAGRMCYIDLPVQRSHPSQYIFETAFHPWLQPK